MNVVPYNEETERPELHVSEADGAREPLAAELAETLMDAGLITRVDPRGRAIDREGQYTEGEWDERLEKYVPHNKKQDPAPDSADGAEEGAGENDGKTPAAKSPARTTKTTGAGKGGAQ